MRDHGNTGGIICRCSHRGMRVTREYSNIHKGMNNQQKTLGLLPLGRSTFDVDYANERFGVMLELLDQCGYALCGPRNLLFDGDAASAAIDDLAQQRPDLILVLQVTFTDAASIEELAGKTERPLLIWSVPEPRDGGRLRLNSFCGLNLASHSLGLHKRNFGWLYCAPESKDALSQLKGLLLGERGTAHIAPISAQQAFPGVQPAATGDTDSSNAARALDALKSKTIARIGEHPAGFSTCRYNADQLQKQTGIKVEEHSIDMLFNKARQENDEQAAAIRAQVSQQVTGLDDVDQPQLTKSLKLCGALQTLTEESGYDAFALRCWPETFTEYGGAVCAAASMLGEKQVPCACEADVYGSVTQLLLQEISSQPVFLVDLVDVDVEDNTAVVWHCGQAPLSMCAENSQAHATIHTNRKMPLLYEFPLRAGTVTLLRWSQARGVQQLIIGTAQMLERDMSFTGTSGVLEFSDPAAAVLERVISSGLEHHVALVYGDYSEDLAQVASLADLPVTRLC